jgi:hypothetical protein
MNKYNVGDKVWYIDFGYRLIIKCTILDIDDKISDEPGETTFMWIDEPIGHAVTDDELIDGGVPLAEIDIDVEGDERSKKYSLTEFRERRIEFIKSTWDEYEEELGQSLSVSDYCDKVEGIDWANF